MLFLGIILGDTFIPVMYSCLKGYDSLQSVDVVQYVLKVGKISQNCIQQY